MTDFSDRRTWGPSPNYPKVLEYYGDYNTKNLFNNILVISGPCSIESEGQVEQVADTLKVHGVSFMRGGVFRAGTYPGKTFGLQKNLLKMWSRVANSYGLKIIVEVIDIRDIDYIDKYADAFQVGARQGQGYALLREISKTKKVVTLKRGSGLTKDEFLGAAEYLCAGKCKPILIERGGVTNHNHVRWELSLSLIAAVKRITGIPILVDASHGTGRRDLVEPMTMAGLAAGADGFIVEVHPEPEKSISDADQAYPLYKYQHLMSKARAIIDARGVYL